MELALSLFSAADKVGIRSNFLYILIGSKITVKCQCNGGDSECLEDAV